MKGYGEKVIYKESFRRTKRGTMDLWFSSATLCASKTLARSSYPTLLKTKRVGISRRGIEALVRIETNGYQRWAICVQSIVWTTSSFVSHDVLIWFYVKIKYSRTSWTIRFRKICFSQNSNEIVAIVISRNRPV